MHIRTRPWRAAAALLAALVCFGSFTSVTAASTTKRALAPGDHYLTLEVQGIKRDFILHVPPGAPVAKRPLILVFHGSRATAQGTIGVTDFEQEANRTGELVAFLQGVNDHWDQYSGTFGDGGIDDVTYTRDVIRDVESHAAFDHARIVAAGFSNGALMVESLGCQMARTLAMVVPVEGQLTTRMTKSCAPGRPISVYEIHGTADTVLPYGGGGFLQELSAPASARKWAALDHCAKTPRGSSPSHSVKVTTYVACRGSAHVALRTLVGGVHRWAPGIGEIVTNALPWRK